MVNTFVNPVVNPEARLGVSQFDETAPARLWPDHSESDAEDIIRAIYRQVLGNAHVMESERLVVAESKLKSGELSVREFVRQLANSDLYRARFFENSPRYRAIELNFKHLLGRAPESYEETTAHSQILDTAGYEAEIDSYLDSDEYRQAFGEDTVPYYQGYKTQTGKRMVGFTHLFKLVRGASASDKNLITGERSRLNQAILTNTPSAIVPPSGALATWKPPIVERQQSTSSAVSSTPSSSQQQYQGYQAFASDPVELCFGFSEADVDVVIRAVYRQVLGNAYVMESERLLIPESKLKSGQLSVHEFVRQVAKSELYRSRFFENCYRYRSIELNFKHLLGRAPDNFNEMRYHSNILDQNGFEADIDAYLDSDEYQQAFGENIVPYYRGYKTQTGQSMLEFTNMLQLLQSASSSDKDVTSGNQPRLTRSLILNRPYGIDRVRDASEILAEVFKPKGDVVALPAIATPTISAAEQALKQQCQEQEALIAALQSQLVELRPFASIGSAVTRQDRFARTATVETQFPSNTGFSPAASPLERQVIEQKALIARLQQQVAESRSLASIGEAQANKWQRRK